MNQIKLTPAALKKIAAEIEKRNAAFKRASPAQKRVLVAKDVIAQINAKTLIPTTGNFIEIHTTKDGVDFNGDECAREAILGGEIENCVGCALGGLFLSCTLFNNKTTVDDFKFTSIGEAVEEGDEIANGLNSIFSQKQLELIEIAFEGGDGYFANPDNENTDTYYDEKLDEYVAERTPLQLKAIKFGNRFRSDKNRLIGIMNNIIKNKGQFIP